MQCEAELKYCAAVLGYLRGRTVYRELRLLWHKTQLVKPKTLASGAITSFFLPNIQLPWYIGLDFHRIRETQATQLHHQSVNQFESTSVLPVFC